MKAILMLSVFQLNITCSSPLFWKTRTRVRPKNSERSLQGWDYKVSLPPNSGEKITFFTGILLITFLKSMASSYVTKETLPYDLHGMQINTI